MAAFEAVLSFGLAVAYVAAAPVMTVIEPQSVYRLGGAGAALAALILVPLLRLRHEPDAGSDPIWTLRPSRRRDDVPAGELRTRRGVAPRPASSAGVVVRQGI